VAFVEGFAFIFFKLIDLIVELYKIFLYINQSINQFISFSINPLQGVHHMDIEMVKKIYIYKF